MNRKTDKEFKQQIFDLVGNEYEFLEEYKNYQYKLKVKHLNCGNIYLVSPANFIRGYRCPYCSKRPIKNKENFNKFLKDNKRTIELIGDYKTIHEKTEFKCLKCNHIFLATPNNVRNGTNCPNCVKNKKLNLDIIKERVKNLDSNYEIIDKNYINGKTKLNFFHKICGESFLMSWTNFNQGYRCPHCSSIYNSKGVKIIKNFLNNHNIKFIQEFKIDGLINPDTNNSLRFDFYLPEKNIYIEYDGEQHFKPTGNFFNEEKFKKIQYLDSIKNNYCKENNLTLIRYNFKQLKILNSLLENLLI